MQVLEERGRSNGSPPTGEVEIALCRLLDMAGFNQQRIAALFGCNQGRINECVKGTNAYEGLDEVRWTFRVGNRRLDWQ